MLLLISVGEPKQKTVAGKQIYREPETLNLCRGNLLKRLQRAVSRASIRKSRSQEPGAGEKMCWLPNTAINNQTLVKQCSTTC